MRTATEATRNITKRPRTKRSIKSLATLILNRVKEAREQSADGVLGDASPFWGKCCSRGMIIPARRPGDRLWFELSGATRPILPKPAELAANAERACASDCALLLSPTVLKRQRQY